MSKKYKYPALTVDIIIFSVNEEKLKVLLIKRKNDPFRNCQAIPGGFVEYDEEIDAAAERELVEETGISGIALEQAGVFGRVGRDPRGRTISIVYFACVNASKLTVKAGDDAKEADWFEVKELPELAFDHAEIISSVLENFKTKIENTSTVVNFISK